MPEYVPCTLCDASVPHLACPRVVAHIARPSTSRRAAEEAIAHVLAKIRFGDDYVGEVSAHETNDAFVIAGVLQGDDVCIVPREQFMRLLTSIDVLGATDPIGDEADIRAWEDVWEARKALTW